MRQSSSLCCVVSTIGTSLLTNQAPRKMQALLRDTANLKRSDYPPDHLSRVADRIREVRAHLEQASRDQVRAMSAELNGLLSLPDEGKGALHYLLRTDTYQGEQTAEMVRNWLLKADYHPPVIQPLEGLSTASQEDFAQGIDSLLQWCDQTLPELRRQQHRIVFNLVGGFKSLQAYAQTLGMVYADEICYIFESASAPLLRIPRLPVKFETESLARHAATVARMAKTGENVSISELRDLPEAYLDIVGEEATLSPWGKLAWNQAKDEVLAGDLLEQPGLVYEESFRRDYSARKDRRERVTLQEALAQASYCWNHGGLAALRTHGGLQYETFENKNGIGHFRVNQGFRVSCTVESGHFRLRHYGPHDYVNDNP
jgi:putative CRISPR-associated protein (TIGR02619 family)